jgi:hypothetical protein
MSTVKTHTTSDSLKRRVRNMVTLLAEGDADFLIGGVITPEGLKPVTFTRNLSDEMVEALSRATPHTVATLLKDSFNHVYSRGTTQ